MPQKKHAINKAINWSSGFNTYKINNCNIHTIMKQQQTETTKSVINLAAIDIGSNAARILIKSAENTPSGISTCKLQFLRIPIRLGMDVFCKGMIGDKREKMLLRTMKIFRQLMILYNVDDYRICATSAFRDAKNSKKILKYVKARTHLDIEVITGTEEARIIRDNCPSTGNALYMDVGGGSTELSLVRDGQLVDIRSFNIGTIRLLNELITPDDWNNMMTQIQEMTKGIENITIIGSGGNINKLYRLTHKSNKKKNEVSTDDLRKITLQLSQLSVEERMEKFALNSSRADVIVPAAQLFVMVAGIVKAPSIHVLNVGLVDGIINEMAKKLLAAPEDDIKTEDDNKEDSVD